ncbi:MAG TPA: GNAT family N-acetyltransferase [Bacillus bacterium]|nr:GNAT family N-acetyltransferase [Bacillus sp. (in: firmicutes)]
MYRSEFFLFHDGKSFPVVIRNYTREDFDELIQIQSECFPPPFPSELWWDKEQLTNHVTLFSDGALCIEVDGKMAGSMTSLIVNFDEKSPKHTWEEITDNGYIRSHNPNGNTLYIVDIAVRPSFRKYGLGKLMMQAMYHVVIQQGLERLLGGGRMPGYQQVAGQLSAEEYIRAVVEGKLKDPVITFLLRCGRKPLAIVENYLDDKESHHYGVLMEWKNPFIHF